ncbi:capsule assembly Wzi family protein [Inquilinus limosus]|uniref:capsule assembly Wzi family protein n=1 Tax=Inquilinus limosus TaxID=171674 RepID=UPI003F151E98
MAVARKIAIAVAAAVLSGAGLATVSGTAVASPWAEPGDATLRNDIHVLENYGLIDGVLNAWPIPWAQVTYRLAKADRDLLPPYVQAALDRVRARAASETRQGQLHAMLRADLTNQPALVHGFEYTARQRGEVTASFEYMGDSTALRLSLGAYSRFVKGDSPWYYAGQDTFQPSLDGTYIAQRVDNWILYAGWLDTWWGPGETTSLILSTNARPFPKAGFMRSNPHAFETPWLSWIGPWQITGFLGVLPDDRVNTNTMMFGLRASINPIPGLELGASRIMMFCGSGRPCGLRTFFDGFFGNTNVDPSQQAQDPANQIAGFDARFSSQLFGQPFEIYGELTGEDAANSDIGIPLPSRNAAVLGASLWNGWGDEGAMWKVNVEYSNSTANFLDRKIFGYFYESGAYPDGYRFYDRSMGDSLDGDAELFGVTGTFIDADNWTYKVAYHHANLNPKDNPRNTVSQSAEEINMLDLGVSIPMRRNTVGINLRLQDDSPNSPGSQKPMAALGLSTTIRF